MRFPFLRSAVALAAALLALAPAANAQLIFNFQFDSSFDATITPPIVGTGVLTLAADPGDGTFVYSALAPLYTFTFGGPAFTQADILSNPNLVLLVISTTAEGRRLQFSDTGASGGGPFGGSLDLGNGSGIITFEPSTVGAGLNLYGSNAGGGTYRALAPAAAAVPEPGTLALLLVGGLTTGAGFLRRRRA